MLIVRIVRWSRNKSAISILRIESGLGEHLVLVSKLRLIQLLEKEVFFRQVGISTCMILVGNTEEGRRVHHSSQAVQGTRR